MGGFSLYKRGKFFYVQFKNIDGSYSTAKSTKQTSRRAAEQWAAAELLKNSTPAPGRTITLKEYATGFFSWEGPWATGKKIEGRRISESHCRDRADLVRLHILPVLGECRLTELDKTRIKNFRNGLYQKGSSGSLINKCMSAIKAMLDLAEDQGLIIAVPKVARAKDTPKAKGILSIEEVTRLFSTPWPMDTPADMMGHTGNLIAATTGLRISELQGLRLGDLHLDRAYITIRHSWDNRLNKLNITTKTGRERNIFLPDRVVAAIRSLLAIHPRPEDPEAFLFWGAKKPDEKPAEKIVFIRSLFRQMVRIGITEDQRRERNITFHSWRHFLNSLLINAKIPLQKIQSITGHLTAEMSQHYYHLDDMTDVQKAAGIIFQGEDLKPDIGEKVN